MCNLTAVDTGQAFVRIMVASHHLGDRIVDLQIVELSSVLLYNPPQRTLNGFTSPIDNLINLCLGDVVWWRNDYMITFSSIHTSTTRIEHDSRVQGQTLVVNCHRKS